MLLAGLFLSTLGLLNVVGLTRIFNFSFSLGPWEIPVVLPLGVLPYPITFLCIDLICEFYGKSRARLVVWVGLFINLWILFILWIAGFLPPHVALDPNTHLPATTDPNFTFYQIRLYTTSGVIGGMVAYLVAQLIDVHIFQFCKQWTQGKHLWLRSNVSTLVSQFIDTAIVISFVYCLTDAMIQAPGQSAIAHLMTIIFSSYIFKMLVTLFSTIPFYIAVISLRKYLAPALGSTLQPLPALSPVHSAQ
jgi:uncharacterized integral membrane protein (TIGR00697 family)